MTPNNFYLCRYIQNDGLNLLVTVHLSEQLKAFSLQYVHNSALFRIDSYLSFLSLYILEKAEMPRDIIANVHNL